MTSLFEKARVAVLGKMHSLLDEVANTPDAYKQRIRDLESALADLRAAGDEATGTRNGYQRNISKLQANQANQQADIDLLLGDDDPTNDDAALRLQLDMEDVTAQLESLGTLEAEANNNRVMLQEAVDKLEMKHRTMVAGLNRITLAAAASKAKNRASSAAEAALEASNAADGASIDSIEANINHEKDVADARFDRVFDNLQSDDTSPEEAAKLARAKAALQARRAQIATQATEDAKLPAPANS